MPHWPEWLGRGEGAGGAGMRRSRRMDLGTTRKASGLLILASILVRFLTVAVKAAPEGLALGQDRDPGQAGREALEGEALKQLTVAGNWNSPLFIVVGEHQPVGGGAVGSGDAARPPTARPDVCDHRRIRGWTIWTRPAMSCRAIARPRSQHWLASICTGHSAPSAIESSTSGERADWPGKVEGSVTTSATGMFPNIGRSSSMPNGCSMASNKRTHA